MPVILSCPQCQKRLRLPDGFSDGLVRCPACKVEFSANSGPTSLTVEPPQQPSPPMAPLLNRDRDEERDPWRRPRREVDRKKPAGNSRGLVIGIVVTVLVVVGLGSAAAWFAFHRRNTPAPLPPMAGLKEDEDERRDDIKKALVDLKPLAEQEIAEELKPMFTFVNAAFRAMDGDQIMAYFDTERMADEFIALAPGVLKTEKDRRDSARGIKNGMKASMVKQAPVIQWTSFEIRNVKKLSETEAVVIARHERATIGTSKTRWWVTRRDGTWKIFDFEDLDSSMRFSVIVATLLQQGIGKSSELTRAMVTIGEIGQAVLAQDLDTADRKLMQIAGVNLPRDLDALRHMLTGSIRIHRGQFKEGLVELDLAGALRPEMPVLDLTKGIAFNGLAEYDKALKHLERYRELLGDDALVCGEMGKALQELRRFAEAARVYRKSLDFNPKNADVFYHFIRSLGDDDSLDDVSERFAKLDDRRENFDTFAADCEQRVYDALLEKIVVSMRKLDPQYPPVDYYSSLLKARARQTAEAVRLFKSALIREKDAEKRKHYTEGFLKAMVSVGKIDEAYAAVPNAGEAFSTLALESLKSYNLDQLKRLTTAHAKKHAKDPMLPWYQAVVYYHEQRYALAEKTFASALADPPNEETLKLFRMYRVEARYRTGKMMSAYLEIGPRAETFIQLANLAYYDENYEQLELLLDAHAKTDPENVELLIHRLRLKCRHNQVAGAIDLFKVMMAKNLPEKDRPRILNIFLYEVAEAGKPLEAYRAAPDAQAAFLQLARTLLDQDRVEELHQLMEAHRVGHATDPWLALYQADLHRNDGAWDKVIAVLAPGMPQASKDVSDQFRWRYTYAMYKLGRGIQAYAESKGEVRDANWTQLANLMLNDKKWTELQALLTAHRPNAANGRALDYYEALIKIQAKKPDEATALLQKACTKPIEDWQKRSYEDGYLRAMAEAGFMLEGYRAVSDKAAALRTLGYLLVNLKKDKELETLLAEHGRGQTPSAEQLFFKGELHFLRGEFQMGEQQIAAANAKSSELEYKPYAYKLNWARVKAGIAIRAYQEAETESQAFEQLAGICMQEKDARQLQELIDAHRTVAPDDPNLSMWDVDLLWLKQDYDGALKRLNENRAEFLARSQSRWRCEIYVVRGLVKLKRTAEAIQEAEAQVKKRPYIAWLLVLAHAAAGDVKETLAVLTKHRTNRYLLGICYEDEDLGPILRSEPFREVREKYPEPKKKQYPFGENPDDD